MKNGKKTQKLQGFFWQQMLLKVVFFALILLLFAELVFVWVVGEQETKDAFSSGRRLVFYVSGDEIEGKIVSSNTETEEDKPDIEVLTHEEKNGDKHPEPEAAVKDIEENITTPESGDSTTEHSVDETADANIANTEIIEETPLEQLPELIISKTPPEEILDKLIDKTEYGKLPKISDDGIKPWKYYSKPFTVIGNYPMISIIVTGLGNNNYTTELALRLPEAVNLSFSPYAKNLSSWVASARLSGHEILIDLPMESSNYPISDPGPLGLLVSREQGHNEKKIKTLMGESWGYVGFVTPHNEAFMENNELAKSLLQVVSGRGLMMVIGKQPSKDITKEIIEAGNTASIISDTLIDGELTEESIKSHLTLLEQLARQRGYAVGIARSYPITIKVIEEWAKNADKNQLSIVPVSVIVSKRF